MTNSLAACQRKLNSSLLSLTAETHSAAVLRSESSREDRCVEWNKVTAGPGRGGSSWARLPESSESRMEFSSSPKRENLVHPKPYPQFQNFSQPRTRLKFSSQTSRQSSIDVASFLFRRNGPTTTWRCHQERRALDTQRDQDQSSPNAFSTGEEASSPSIRQAPRAGAPNTHQGFHQRVGNSTSHFLR